MGNIEPFVTLNSRQLSPRDEETLTSLEDLMYYPHKWVFRHKARLSKSSILTIAANNTLKGNLAHRYFELILKENFDNWTRDDVDEWVNTESPRLLRKEAATLLMYGYEPERVQFVSQIKYAVWTLISFIQKNSWTVSGTEIDLSGKFGTLPVRGKADVVLQRQNDNSKSPNSAF
ncbi:MAG: hypothetical protein HC817_13290 [Saprospiraceae bacterium]|nr:hypothetical protein [Saprospiraceae bacterium]